MEKVNEIHFKTQEAATLWEFEILGQLSDGYWENITPMDHWKFWHECKVVVDGKIGHTENGMRPKKTGYNLYALNEYVGDEMRNYVTAVKYRSLDKLKNIGIKDSYDQRCACEGYFNSRTYFTKRYPNLKDRHEEVEGYFNNGTYFTERYPNLKDRQEEVEAIYQEIEDNKVSTKVVNDYLYEIKKAMTTVL